MARYMVRPSRGLSAVTGVVGLVLAVVGLVFFGYRWADGGSPVPLVFVGLWLAVCLALTGYHLFNAATGRGPGTGVVERDD
jgi:hypothetical protein